MKLNFFQNVMKYNYNKYFQSFLKINKNIIINSSSPLHCIGLE